MKIFYDRIMQGQNGKINMEHAKNMQKHFQETINISNDDVKSLDK